MAIKSRLAYFNVQENSNASLFDTVNVDAYTDTGHQYLVIPLKPKPGKTPAVQIPAGISRLAQTKQQKWQTSVKFPWVRFRLTAVQEGAVKSPILLVAYETNLSTNRVGTKLIEVDGETAKKLDSAINDASPYAGQLFANLGSTEGDRKVSDVLITLIDGEKNERLDVRVRVSWFDPATRSKPTPIDLLVDLGNSRTAAALFEPPIGGGFAFDSGTNLRNYLKPLFSLEREARAQDVLCRADGSDSPIIDSWIALQEPFFSGLEFCEGDESLRTCLTVDSVKQFAALDASGDINVLSLNRDDDGQAWLRVPQTFVELSPLLVGAQAAETLDNAKGRLSGGEEYLFLSSPKRYSWDKSARHYNWVMERNLWSKPTPQHDSHGMLAGNVLRFMRQNSADWALTNPPNESPVLMERPFSKPPLPRHARANMLTLMVLHLIENAWLQIGAQGGNRYLRDICVTYPSGWTADELKAYVDRWQEAINIFALNHLRRNDAVPALRMNLDEAIATQIPLIYEGVLNQFKSVDSWIDLYGKYVNPFDPTNDGGTDVEQDKPLRKTVRIMTFDIGGGTSDVAIVEYSKREDSIQGTAKLASDLLFRDSSYNAGDSVLKRVLETVLISRLNPFDSKHQETDFNRYREFWQASRSKELQAKISFLVRRFLIPLANTIFAKIASENPIVTENDIKIDESTINTLNTWFRQQFPDRMETTPLFGSNWKQELNKVVKAIITDEAQKIESAFQDVLVGDIKGIAQHAKRYDIDLIIFSGKPSEMPCVRRMIADYIPLPESRRINVKGLPIGRWYPFKDVHDRIEDAKNVNLVGLALESLVWHGDIDSSLSITPTDTPTALESTQWIISNKDKSQQMGGVGSLFANGPVETVTFEHHHRICRRFPGTPISSASPVYQFYGIVKDGIPAKTKYEAQIEIDKQGAIRLKQETICRLDKQEITEDERGEIELRLVMMECEDFWMDKPDFSIKGGK